MIIRNPDPATTSIYLPILTSIVGVWLPQPATRQQIQTVQTLPVPRELDNV